MITQSMIIELREKTGAGVLNCHNTLKETNGDIEKAIVILKEKGFMIAAQKAERITAEGLIGIYVTKDHQAGSIIEINCETDFVAANKSFIELTARLAEQAAKSGAESVNQFAEENYIADDGITVRDAVTSLIAKLRENITIRRFNTFTTQSGFIQGYNHNCGRIGALVEITCEKADLTLLDIGKELAMQITASKPLFINREDVPVEILEKEKQIFKSEALGKPEAIVDKIVTGKMERFFREKCLVEQVWIKNEEMTIADYLREESGKLKAAVKVVRFVRFERGEGLEKRVNCQK